MSLRVPAPVLLTVPLPLRVILSSEAFVMFKTASFRTSVIPPNQPFSTV